MANIILKGRDADGNIVETTYENITSVAFETEEGGTVIFHESDVTAKSFNSYICVPVREGEPEYSADTGKMRILAMPTGVITEYANSTMIAERYLNEYGVPDQQGQLIYWTVITFKMYAIGDVVSYSELFGVDF